jgi:hypothetical protein
VIRTANRVFTTAFSQSTAATHTVVAATAGRKVRVTGYHLVAGGTNTVKFADTTPADLTGAMPVVANGALQAAGTADTPLVQTADGKGLTIVLSAAQAVTGYVTYTLEASK